ncbi:MAG TPA: hypothetical protein VFR67_25010 [Pilimelia sp.]|nr:hypothetical protein [Pilimelia sp.]
MTATLSRTRIALTATEHASLRAAVERDAPALAGRIDDPVDIDRLEQPWFRHRRILDVQSPVPFLARRIHVALDPAGQALVLTRKLEHLQQVAAADPPPGLDAAEEAATYATYASAWTRESPLGELKLSSFADIPWPSALDPATVEALRDRWGDAIQPETRNRLAGGWLFRSWWLVTRRLVERELLVPPDGRLQRTDIVNAEQLPVPLGNYWQLVNGRLIPVG